MLPPPLHDDAHVEAQDEGDRDEIPEVVAVEGEVFEDPVEAKGEFVRQGVGLEFVRRRVGLS